MSHAGRLQGKVAIITGAGNGLGEGIARKFTIEGAKVVLFEINEQNAKKVASSLPSASAAVYIGDATNQADWDNCLKLTIDTFDKLDIVVNNAGVIYRAAVSLSSAH